MDGSLCLKKWTSYLKLHCPNFFGHARRKSHFDVGINSWEKQHTLLRDSAFILHKSWDNQEPGEVGDAAAGQMLLG